MKPEYQIRTRFASVVICKRSINLQLWLRRRVSHPLLRKVEMYTYRDHGHIFRLRTSKDIDEQRVALIHESYALGIM